MNNQQWWWWWNEHIVRARDAIQKKILKRNNNKNKIDIKSSRLCYRIKLNFVKVFKKKKKKISYMIGKGERETVEKNVKW